jgi:two-component sensor histidine kinase
MSISIDHGIVELAEADHRIANNLASLGSVVRLQRSAISSSGKSFTSDEVCALLDEISARIEVTARLHKLLAADGNGNGVNLGDFLQEISRIIASLSPHGKMEIAFQNNCDAHIDPRHALHTGLIMSELLTNASKYAHPAGLPVTVNLRCDTKEDGSFTVEVTDDGVGFPENFDTSTDGGLGFRLMRALANGLGAELRFEHDCLGVRASLIKSAR